AQGGFRAGRADDHVCRDAGVRSGGRPPGRVLPRRGLAVRRPGGRRPTDLMTARAVLAPSRSVAPAPRRVLDGRFLLAVLLLWTLLRAVSAVILHQLAHHHQDPVVYDEPDVPLYFQFATLWDGQWYERIATQGYPQELPTGADGQVRQNPWAFYPIFPMLARGVMALTGWPFSVAGTLVAVVLGYGAAILVAGLLREKVGTAAA